ncbi:MAG TPA: SH3 domain-containing protein [Oceanobacillus sp.]|nr:SH3 domain-containing protein [Oceanobacillus sp.]
MKLKAKVLLFTLLLLVLAVPLLGVVASDAQQRQFALPIVVVNTGNLNVRTGPGPQFTVLTTVPGGTELPVLGRNQDSTWYMVATAIGAGWVDISFTIPRGDFSYVPFVRWETLASPVVQPLPQSLGLPTGAGNVAIPQIQVPQVIVNTGNLNVRSGPGAIYTVIATVPGGTTFEPLGVTEDGAWYFVDVPRRGRGWISAEYTIFRGSYDAIPVIVNAY